MDASNWIWNAWHEASGECFFEIVKLKSENDKSAIIKWLLMLLFQGDIMRLFYVWNVKNVRSCDNVIERDTDWDCQDESRFCLRVTHRGTPTVSYWIGQGETSPPGYYDIIPREVIRLMCEHWDDCCVMKSLDVTATSTQGDDSLMFGVLIVTIMWCRKWGSSGMLVLK